MNFSRLIPVVGVAVLASACVTYPQSATMTTRPFGQTSDGRAVTLYELTAPTGFRVRLLDYGAMCVSIETPDREGRLDDVVLGCDSVADYDKSPYIGAIAGRYANRIAKGKFTLDGVEHTLSTNNPPNHLHGGTIGFNKVMWKAEKGDAGVGDAAVKFSYESKDGEEGYPGNLKCSVTYTVTHHNELKLSYEAETDKSTVVNLTQHNYYNLAGQGAGSVFATSNEIMINADRYTPFDDAQIPTGELASVAGTPFDFRKSTRLSNRLDVMPGGYDHNFAINGFDGKTLRLAARAHHPASGRTMEVWTTEPGLQFFTGNFQSWPMAGKNGVQYVKNAGFCVEAQRYPDTPNHPDFPSAVLRPGEKYRQETLMRFYVR